MDLTKKNAQVNLVLEGTDSGKAMVINKTVTNSITTVAAKSVNITSSLKIDINSLYGNSLSFTDLFMTLVTLLLSMAVVILTILRNKMTGVFNKRIEAPVKTDLVYTIGLSTFSFSIALIVLSYVTYVMDLTIAEGMSSIMLLMFLIAVMGVSLGVFAVSITRTKKHAMGIFGPLLVLQIIFGGLFVLITRFDYYTQLISHNYH